MTEGPGASRRVFNGRYEIIQQIARGGMAEVYLAHDLLLDRRVALKVLFPELSTDRAFVERFRREAQAAANLTHPNIVSIFDWGEENGTYFIVMEYVQGRSLSTLLREEGKVDPATAAQIGAAVAAALAAAHRGGVIHRDIKPGNVLIDQRGEVKVTDFGIARATDSPDDLTRTGSVLGTAAYFSPEQAQGFHMDARSDVYSLGVVLYELVVGQPPFTGKTPVAIAYKHVRELPLAPRNLDSSIPSSFESIVLHAMEKDPVDRYASADELRADLLRFSQGQNVLAPTPMAATQAVARTQAVGVAGGPAATTVSPMYEPERRHTGAYLGLLFLLASVLLVLLFLLGQQVGLFDTGGSTAKVDVPNVVNQPKDTARSTLEAAGFVVDVVPEENEAEIDTVFAQDPEGGTRAEEGSTVTLRVSSGKGNIAVPRVIGSQQADAEAELRELGFEVEIKTEDNEDLEAGTVITQDPEAGTEVAEGSTVVLTVSAGTGKAVVPDVRNKDADVAANELGRAGFETKRTSAASSEVAEGKVIRTDPAGGTEAEEGSTVTMVVSTGPDQTTVPDVVGLTEAEARSRLTSAGFQVDVRSVAVTDPDDDGRVITQSPGGGTQAARGSTVQIRVGQALTTSSSSTTTTTTP